MPLICEFCGKTSIDHYKLKRHQQTKACLRAQDKLDEHQGYPCLDCGAIISSKYKLPTHLKICVLYNTRITEERIREEYFDMEEENETLRAEKEEFQARIIQLEATLAAKPTITINQKNTYNTLIQADFTPITQKLLDDQAKTISKHDVLSGGIGVARHTMKEHECNILCTDLARQKLLYKHCKNRIYTDPKGKKLSQMSFAAVKPIAAKIFQEILLDPESSMPRELQEVYAEMNSQYSKAANGEESTLHPPFIDEVVARTLKQNHSLLT